MNAQAAPLFVGLDLSKRFCFGLSALFMGDDIHGEPQQRLDKSKPAKAQHRRPT